MRTGRLFIGLILVCLGMVLFFNPIQTIFLVDNAEHTYLINSEVGGSGNSTITINFDFDREYISGIYQISDGEKIYQNYVNVYIDEYIENASESNISYYQLNNHVYVPENKSYQNSLMIIDGTLNEMSQVLTIHKDSALEIGKVTMDYIGADFENEDNFNNLAMGMTVLIIFTGLFLCLSGVRG